MSSNTPVQIPMLIGAEWRAGKTTQAVIDPYRQETVALAPNSQLADVEDAVTAAVQAKTIMADMPGYERAALLRRVNVLLVERADAIAEEMAREMGKPVRDARAEILRSQDTISLSAEEAIRIEGEQVPLDGAPMGAGKLAFMLRFPVGVVAAITPFNAPFNLAAHKLGPAIAAGNSVVIKAPPQAPLTVHRLIEMFIDAGAPVGAVNALYGNDAGPQLVRDKRVDFITFTGSSRVGEIIKGASGLRRVALELGGTGTTIVCDDADVADAARQCARNSMRIGGQSCISVQNVYVHRSRYQAFLDVLVAEVKNLKMGDPLDPTTDLGALVDVDAARRVESWVAEAVAGGATLHTGGKRHGAQFEATVLSEVTPVMKVVCEEVFGPVVSVLAFDDVETVFEAVSASPFGLQCGIFTKSLPVSMRAVRKLRTGGVILNGTSTWRTDQLAYGGVKSSGIGREGPRYAIRDMTEERLVVFNL